MCRILKGFVVFAISLGICICLLIGVCSFIPQSSIHESCLKAESYFAEMDGSTLVLKHNLGSRTDHYADAALLDVIYNVDSSRPLYSIIAAPYYRTEGTDIRNDLHSSIVEGLAPNSEYARYWHGSQILIRPLLLFSSVTGCRLILFILLLALNAVLSAQLIRRKAFRPLFLYWLALFAVQFWMTAFTLEYISIFLIMTLGCIAVTHFFSNPVSDEVLFSRMSALFIASGALSCFFDFLTTETLTFTIPFILFLMLRKENACKSFSLRDILKLMLRWGSLWLCAYAAAYAVKWILVLFVLGKDAFLGIFESAAVRINREYIDEITRSSSTTLSSRLPMMLARNIGCLYPLSENLSVPLIFWSFAGILLMLGAVFYLFRSSKTDGAFIAALLLTGLIPYLRFLALSSHSHDHFFFTYRAPMATIMALGAIMAYSLNPSEALRPSKKKRRS